METVVELYLVKVPSNPPDILLRRWCGFLNAEESIRLKRFHHENDRLRYLLARTLCRSMLGRRIGIAPGLVNFDFNHWGKPLLPGTGLEFNLAHSGEYVVLAVAKTAVGIDLENVTRVVNYEALAKRYFAAEEQLWLLNTPTDAKSDIFYKIWTLKEAWLKGVGKGLRIKLSSFFFQQFKKKIQLSAPTMQQETPDHWGFYSFVHENYRITIAALVSQEEQFSIVLRELNSLEDLI
jgi:4'-phosphopantetheinyl transferase